MSYTNSSLVSYTKLSPNNSGKRTHSIIYITPHCVVGQLSVESIGSIFAPKSRKASSNYGIGADGRIGMYCEEKNRSWCSSSSWNDNRAVTIENACDLKHPYAMNDKVYASLIKLCADICLRNGKKKLLWLGDKSKTMTYTPKADEMVLTAHRWYSNTACPGDWLYSRLGDLASKVTAELGGSSITYTEAITPTLLKKGSRGDNVKVMQTLLIKAGYSCGSAGADGIFGNDTLFALKSFQQDHGLTADGIYGPKSKAALEAANPSQNTTVLRKGDKGDAVRMMQTMLIACGYPCGNTGADGDFGNKTKDALMRFQKDHGVAVDGLYGPQSRASLTQAYLVAH